MSAEGERHMPKLSGTIDRSWITSGELPQGTPMGQGSGLNSQAQGQGKQCFLLSFLLFLTC